MNTNRNICIAIAIVGILVALGLHFTQPYISDRNGKITAFGDAMVEIIDLNNKKSGLPLKKGKITYVGAEGLTIHFEIEKPSEVFKP
ncbi:MAG: hypothetical protein V4469_03150 [Patescibacteria group bacterium]